MLGIMLHGKRRRKCVLKRSPRKRRYSKEENVQGETENDVYPADFLDASLHFALAGVID